MATSARCPDDGKPDIVRALLEAGGDPKPAMEAAAKNPAMQGFDWSPYLDGG